MLHKDVNMTIRFVAAFLFYFFAATAACAGKPLWLLIPATSTTISVSPDNSATVLYVVTNQSSRSHTLSMQPITGVSQVTLGSGACSDPFTLSPLASCILSLQVNGYQLSRAVNGGPIVCESGSANQCYQPNQSDVLHVTQAAAVPLPSGCEYTGDNNIQCTVTISSSTNYGFTNMAYALCRSAQCPYDGVSSTVQCSCTLIKANLGLYSASTAPSDYNTSKPSGNKVTSTYSRVNSSGETPTTCPSGPFANCFGASCTVSGSSVTCTCPVVVDSYIAPQTNCVLGSKIWSATSVSSFTAIDGTMQFMYDNFFGGNEPR